jgi:hypothetical protein
MTIPKIEPRREGGNPTAGRAGRDGRLDGRTKAKPTKPGTKPRKTSTGRTSRAQARCRAPFLSIHMDWDRISDRWTRGPAELNLKSLTTEGASLGFEFVELEVVA